MIRLFVALRPPEPTRDALLDLMDEVDAARWQSDEQLHLTLRFIGEVERPIAEELATAISRLRGDGLSLRLHGVGAFGGRSRAGSLWVGVEPGEAVAALHRKVDRVCVGVGLSPEHRAFAPHITVARLPKSASGSPEVARWQARHAAFATEPFRLDRLTLYRSTLGRSGAVYEPVVEVALDRPAGVDAAGVDPHKPGG